MKRILIADDHAVVREGLKGILAKALGGGHFSDAATGEDVLRLARSAEFDLVILDVSLPDRDGLDVLKQLKRSVPRLPVLVLSMYAEEDFALQALRAGAAGYLTKRGAAEEIVRAVRRVVAGGKYVSEAVAERLAEELHDGPPLAPHERLSDREFQVFQRMAVGKTMTAIARELSVSAQTVSTYRARIFEKTGLHSREELTRYAMRNHLFD